METAANPQHIAAVKYLIDARARMFAAAEAALEEAGKCLAIGGTVAAEVWLEEARERLALANRTCPPSR